MTDIESRTLAAKLVESIPDMAYVVSPDGRLTWWNERLSAVTGYSDEELAGTAFTRFVPEDQREAAAAAFADAMEAEADDTREFDVLTKDGERIPHEYNGTAIREDGEIVGVVGVARDVSDRREREAELRRQRDELETLYRISEAIHDVVRTLMAAASRDELESAVCDRLAASELYRAVWIGRNTPGDSVAPHVGAGAVDGFLGAVEASEGCPESGRPPAVAIRTGELQVVRDVGDAGLPAEVEAAAEDAGIRAGASVPLSHRETVYGVLTVYSARPDAFSERERDAFRRLGEIIGFAINAVQTEQLLLSDTVTELTFRVTGADSFLASVSEAADGACRHHWSSAVEDGRYRHYVTVEGLDPEAVAEVADRTGGIEHCSHLGTDGEDHAFEVVTSDSLVRRLVDAGASPSTVVARDGVTTVVVDVPRDGDLRAVVAAARETYDVEVVAKREVDRPVRTTGEYAGAVADGLTERQETVLRHAFLGGYYKWPREATAEELADSLDITSPTFHYHVRGAERALVEAYVEGTAGAPPPVDDSAGDDQPSVDGD